MSLVNKHDFDRLPGTMQNQLNKRDSHSLLADRTWLSCCGIIQLPIRLRDIRTEKVFVSVA